MGRGRHDHLACRAQQIWVVGRFEAADQAVDGRRVRRGVRPHDDFVLAPGAGHDRHDPTVGSGDLQQFRRQPPAELAVGPQNEPARRRRGRGASVVDHSLDLDVGPGLQLQVALFRLGGIVRRHRPLNVAGMCGVSLDQVRVVAVHGAHEAGRLRLQSRRHASLEGGVGADQLHRHVLQFRRGGALGRHKRLHGGRHRAGWYAGHKTIIINRKKKFNWVSVPVSMPVIPPVGGKGQFGGGSAEVSS